MTRSYLEEIFSKPEIIRNARDCSNQRNGAGFLLYQLENGLIGSGGIVLEDVGSLKQYQLSSDQDISSFKYLSHWSKFALEKLEKFTEKSSIGGLGRLVYARRIILTQWRLEELSEEDSLILEMALSDKDKMSDPRRIMIQIPPTADYLMLNELKIINPNVTLISGRKGKRDSPDTDLLVLEQTKSYMEKPDLRDAILSDSLSVMSQNPMLKSHVKKIYTKLTGVLNLDSGELNIQNL